MARGFDAVVVLSGVTLLAVAAAGASMSDPSLARSLGALAVADAGATNTATFATEEFEDLRAERRRADVQAARSAARATTDVAPPTTEAPAATLAPQTTPAYVTVAVNVRAAASNSSEVIAVLDLGAAIAVTGQAAADYVEIVHDGQLAWVYAAYVTDKPPAVSAGDEGGWEGGGVSGEPCPSGSGVESGLIANAVAVHRAVCALFPGVSSYGGLRPGDGGEHGSGHAVDIIVSTDLGNEIAAYLQAHAGELGIRELIWRQRIWSTERAGDGWRGMEDRGSATANHYDHVHVTVG